MGGGLGMFGLLGLLLQIFLIVMVVRFLFRFFTGGRSPVMAGGPNIFARGGMPGPGPVQGGPRPEGRPDRHQPRRLPAVRAIAESHPGRLERADLNALQAMATPEMVSYFAEQLSERSAAVCATP